MLYTPYVWPCLVAGLLMAGIGWYVSRHYDVPAAGSFQLMMWGGAGGAFTYALALSTPVLSDRVWLGNGVIFFALWTTTAILVMTVEYIGRGFWLTRRRLAGLLVVAGLIAGLAFSSPYHTLFRYNFHLDLSYGFAGLLFSTGPFYALYIGYILATGLTSVALLIWSAARWKQAWSNTVLLTLGILSPLTMGLIYAVGRSPVRGFDFSYIGLVLTGLFILAALTSGRFLEVTHIARDLLTDSIQDVVLVLDARGHVVDLNRVARQVLGLAGKSVIGTPAAALPAPWPDLLQSEAGRAVGQQDVTIETGGRQRVFDLTLTPVHDGRGRVVGRLCLAHDVTERTWAEDNLRESEEKFRRLAETTPNGLFIFDGQHFVLTNAAFRQISGYSEADLAAMDALDVLHPDQRELVRTWAAERLKGSHPPARYEAKLATRSGEERWVDMSVALVTYQGRPAVLGTCVDITERRWLEDSLRASQALYLRIVEDQTDPICRWQPDTTIIFVNQAYCNYFGRPRERLIGTPFTELLPPETQAQVRAAIGTLLRRETDRVSQEEVNLSPAGEKRWMVWAYEPIATAEGAITEFQSVGRDITDRKRTEQALQRANEDLAAQLEKVQSLQAQLFEQAVRDMLTGLFNRRYMQETLEREIAAATRAHYPISLIMLDLDFFKKLNDTCGHKAGDLVLHSVGQILREHTRQMDVACRFGGEEFVIIMPTTPLEVASRRADLLRRAVESLSIAYLNGTLHTTISAGVAVFPNHGDTSDALLRSADEALYAAKAAGRNCVRAFVGRT